MKAKQWGIYYCASFTRKENETIFGIFERTNLVRHKEEHYCTASYYEPVQMDLTSAIYICMDHFSSIKSEEYKKLIISGSTTLEPYRWEPICE